MCRLLGVICNETTDFRFSLHEAPRSLAVLSAEHADGWGLAVHCDEVGWDLHRNPVRAGECDRFREVAASARGELLIAHIRKRTVGPIGLANTHPFRRGDFVMAHNGTIPGIASLASRTSEERRKEVEGETDSERFFAFLLTRLDELGHDRIDDALLAGVNEALQLKEIGAANFLFSNGTSLWAFRCGRTLHVLERRPGDPVREVRIAHETEAELDTPWTVRRHAVLIASEKMTDEPWREVSEGTLLRVDGRTPRITTLRQ
jgi:predicted glutamine amidotransferase